MKRFVILILIAGCGQVHSADSNGAPARVVTIGDNVASNPSYAKSYISLLVENDEQLFPEFSGRDLKSHLGAVDLIRLDSAGDSYRGLAQNPLCTCSGESCADRSPCIDTANESKTLVIIQLGVNDLYNLFLRMVSEAALRNSPEGALNVLRTSVREVLSTAAASFAVPPAILVINVFDPTDGRGDLAALAATIIPLPPEVNEVTPETVALIIDGTNAMIREEAQAIGATVVDIHGAFLGHGWHYDEPDLEHHHVDDATHWYRSIIEPNLRGAHEIRRALWNQLSREDLAVLPSGLPIEGTFGLPEVPEAGWADRVVSSHIAQEIEIEGLGFVSNAAPDPSIALGPPQSGLDQIVAIGAIGDEMILELFEVAEDGEGEDLVVIEFGPLSGGIAEPYRVSVANDPHGPFVHVGDGAGERAFDLREAGISSARYVRIESLVHLIDLPALGSPYFPGPEISAVGAVHPK